MQRVLLHMWGVGVDIAVGGEGVLSLKTLWTIIHVHVRDYLSNGTYMHSQSEDSRVLFKVYL